MKKISIPQLKKELSTSGNPKIFVDVRTPEEFQQGHISGFTNMPLSGLEENLSFFNQAPKFILMCRTNGRSKRAAERLEKYFPEKTFLVLEGGYLGWQEHRA